ncbi:MAG: glycosyltransferase family 4 protein [Gaiellaceae bacterium]
MSRRAVLHVQKVSGISGSETHLLSLLPELRARGWDVRFLMLHEREPGAREFGAALARRGVPVSALRLRADADPVAFVRLLGRLLRERPLLVHAHLVHADVYALVAGALARVPVRVSTKHGFNAFRDSRVFGRLDRAVGRLAKTQIAISRGLARYLSESEGFDESSFRVVHYGIDRGPEPGPAGRAPRILCVGRLVPIKGHEVLLRAFAQLRRELPEAELALAGEGSLEPSLRALASDLGVADGVTFLGRVSPVQPALESALLVAVPSLGEGFGMVALEAQERARAVVASSVGGLPEIVEDGVTGILVPPGDSEALAAALATLIRDAELARRMGAAGRMRALSLFGQEQCAERTDEIYREALAAAGVPDPRR